MADLTSQEGAVGDLPRISQTDLLARYRTRVELSRKWREHEGYEKVWNRMRDMYAGKQFATYAEEDRIAVNIAFATVNVIAPSVAVNHPKITIAARTMENEDKATIAEAVINYWWRHYDYKAEFRRTVKDSLVYGHGWLKVGYRYEEHLVPLTDEEFADQFHLAKGDAADYADQNPDQAHLVPTDDEIVAGLPDHKPVVVEDRPFVERVSPYDIFVDPEATSERDMHWICQRIVRPYEEVKADKRYPAGVRRNLKADAEITEDWRDPARKYGDDVKRVTIYEFYDLERKTLSVFPHGGDAFLVKPIPMPYTYGIPFVMLRNYDKPDEFYPMGDLEALGPLQDELNETRSQMVQARKQDLPKLMYRKSLSSAAVDALTSDNRNEMVGIDDDTPFEQLVAPVPQATPQAQLYQHSETIEADVDRISGVNEYMRGGVPETRRTATEASIIQDAANARAADKLDQVENCISEVAERVLALAQQYLTGVQVARVTGQANQHVWVPFTRKDIEGEFDFTVEGGSTQPMNESFRRQQATQLLQAMQPFLESQLINVPALLEYTLQFGFGVTNPGRFISQTPPAPAGPDEKLVETMAYKDTPPDIQRQIEAQAGFQPSSVGGSSPAEQNQGDMQQPGASGQTGPDGQPVEQVPEAMTGNSPASLGAQATDRLNK